tara:strand:- start:1221 stop:2495 length:1275 start_codon:yes stop_codon:yes gene_type:complete
MITRRIFLGGTLLTSGGLAAFSNKGAGPVGHSLPPGDDVGGALNARISDIARRGGGTLHLQDGVYGTHAPIRLHGGVELIGSGKTIIRAAAPIGSSGAMRSLIETPEGERNCALVNLTLDCADKVSFAAWRAVAPNGLRCERVTAVGWHFGLYFVSSRDAPAQDVLISDTVVRNGGSRQVYPVFLSSTTGGQPFRRLTVEGLKIVGSGGAYARDNAATADQLALQNVQGFSLRDVVSQDGGENGIVIVRGSRDGIVRNITVSGADGHGLQIGGGGVAATVDDPGFLAKGAEVRGGQSGAHARVEQIRGNRVWLSRLTQRQLTPGEELWSAGQRSVIRDLEFCRNISVTGLRAFGNGQNVANARGLFADLYISHAEDISVEGINLETPPDGVPILVNNSRRIPCELPSRAGVIRARRTGEVICAG